jgi:hypothetical protein
MLSKEAPETTIIERLIIRHSAFSEAERQIEQCFAFSVGKGEAEALAIIGESGTGKSTVLNVFADGHKPTRSPDGLNVPVLLVSAPSAPTAKNLAGIMLEGLGADDAMRGTEDQRTRRVKTLIRETGTRLVMIDEFQHFVDQGTQRVIRHVADWLKGLINDTRSTLVVAGLPSCMAVVDQNAQLTRRFSAPIHMPRFQWDEPEERRQFVAILRGVHRAISREIMMPDLSSEEMALRVYLATGGLMGYVSKLLRQLLRNARVHTRNTVTLAEMHEAHLQAIWSVQRLQDLPQPFSSGFRLEGKRELLQQANRLGTPAVDQIARSRTARKSRRTVEEVLSGK